MMKNTISPVLVVPITARIAPRIAPRAKKRIPVFRRVWAFFWAAEIPC
jgi:hypothetical protein